MNTLIKPIVRVGNSAGVLLPKAWMNSKARIELIQESVEDITQKIMQILIKENLLSDIKGIYLTGSYARNEQNLDSDIDILIITSNINKRINQRRYDLLLISEENLKILLEENIMPLLPMITEAKPILNKQLIINYKKILLTKKNLKWHIETTKSALKMNESSIKINKELWLNKTGDAIAYSLILRLRGVYIINCLRNNKLWNNRELINLIKKITGSTIAYERYLYIKNEKGKSKNIIPIIEAEKLLDYVKKQNLKQERWIKTK